MKKTLLISTFLVSILYHFQVNATELTDALRENKSLAEIQTLIKNGANVNQSDEEIGYYPLMMVKDTAIFQELVNAGADIKAKTQDGNSVFNITCAQGTLDMVKFLLTNTDSNINEISGGMTPLMRALFN
ncbi:MAG: ankyrin repeat domain-containing protein, partial [Alphaproteobacteria bacterium]|nr:ankyrin repeat domain-containing protein [Alphaproteobacteria bacterium]